MYRTQEATKMKPTSVTRLIAITESYTPKTTAFALYNACTQLILTSQRYDHLRNGVEENAAKLAADLLSESDTFFKMNAEQADNEQQDDENASLEIDSTAS